MNPTLLSHQLRRETGGSLAQRRAIVGLSLAAIGGKHRATEKPWLPLALAGKALVDAFQAARLTRDQAVKHDAYCFWCLLAATATFLAVPFALSEARVAVRGD